MNNNPGKALLAVFVILLLAGCASLKSGGAPDPSFNVDADIQQLTDEFSNAASIANFYRAPSKEARDRFITGRLVLMDLQYLKFIRTLTSDKQQVDSATDIANLTLNLAGTLVGGIRAKTNLAAAGAGISGTKTIIDKNYYYEKSIDALVATMNARRKEILVRILEGLPQPLDKYPFTQAVTDLQAYYLAGTLNGALQFIQTDAGQRETQSDAKIAQIRIAAPYTAAEIDVTKQLTDAIGSPQFDLAKARQALKILGLDDSQAPDTVAAAQALLRRYVREAKPGDALNRVRDAFVKAGLLAK